jgi:hypothetical protein
MNVFKHFHWLKYHGITETTGKQKWTVRTTAGNGETVCMTKLEMASLNQARSSNSSTKKQTNARRSQVVSGVMPWQLEAEMERRSNPQGQNFTRKPRNKSRNDSALASANSASQLQQRLIGGMNLSMALPRSRIDRASSTSSSIIHNNGSTWNCSVCGTLNNWREGDSCQQCFQSTLLLSTNSIGGGGRGGGYGEPVARGKTQPTQSMLSAKEWESLESKAASRQVISRCTLFCATQYTVCKCKRKVNTFFQTKFKIINNNSSGF